jgi:hypothetical protein
MTREEYLRLKSEAVREIERFARQAQAEKSKPKEEKPQPKE